MNDIFQKFCYYLITKGTKKEYEEIKELAKQNRIDFKKLQTKTIKYVADVTKKAEKLGFSTDFESFSNMLEEYINKKEKLTDKKKTEYLKVLAALSEIYEINLRSELETFIKDVKDVEIVNSDTIFNKFCLYNIKEDTTPAEFNELKEISLLNNLNYDELNQKSLEYIEKIKIAAEELNSKVDLESFYKLLNRYLLKKKSLKDNSKAKYLKVLVSLANIYSINIKEELTKKVVNRKVITNPLNDELFLESLITERYNSGSFDVASLITPKTKMPKEDETYNYIINQIELMKNIIDIYLVKDNSEINITYQIVEKSELENITESDIQSLIESEEDNNLTKFIRLLYDITDYTNNHIGNKINNIFNIEENKNTFAIYITTPNDENTFTFLNTYILKCINNNISYDMCGFKFDGVSRDRTILYANEKDITKKIEILNEIQDNYPEIITKFGTPLECTATINNSYYGIATLNNYSSYIEYFNAISEYSYYRVLAKLITNKITKEEDKNILNNFIMLKDVSISNFNPLEITFNNNDFSNIKDLINRHIPDIINTLNIYIEQDDKRKELVSEFRKSLLYIYNIQQNKNKKEESNIALGDVEL